MAEDLRMNRYARQMVLPQIGADGQARLTQAHALVVGAGGLGVPALCYLAGAGVGTITLLDGDDVAQSNLHRQPLYNMTQLGQPKAQAAMQALSALNPDITLDAQQAWLDPDNAPKLIQNADIVLDCADTFACSLILSDICHALCKPLISASALEMAGYVLGCCQSAPSLRAVFPDLPARGASCASAGVMGPMVGAIGALQAQMALCVLLNLTPSPLGQLLRFDSASWHSAAFRFDGAPEPSQPLQFIARKHITDDDLLIDLRVESAPFSAQARHMPPDAIDKLAPAPNQRVVLACATGLRAHHAGQALQQRWQGDIALLALNE